MKIRFRLIPSALALSFLIGCAGEEDAATETPPAPASPAPVPSPAAGTAKKPDAAPAPTEPAAKKAPELTPAPAEPEAKDKAPADEAKKADAKPSLEGPSADAAVKLTDEEVASIKELPADEQPAALAQAVCPVSDEHLGSMGAPIKVTAEGRTFYLCCKGCQKDVKEDAKAVIAKLDKLGKK